MKTLSVQEVADYFGVSRETVVQWDKEKRLVPTGRTKQGWRYYLFADVERLEVDLAGKRKS
ncbi:hypothetical protein BBC27_12100 [Acidithiobacillus ferrivorans]|uniref:HTH merR-type domain-containing protein n=1 Tax=Acidithiobacillus ferrivorans TaxID=160808 RepID=A0A1B9BY69_9PROT|nr:MerR family transcriptional regulator [Acidithiobacillus ferrivorans]OCB02658.1 hypothetical protein BBC27_12100 [Acidithiobacillus ferrivorans]